MRGRESDEVVNTSRSSMRMCIGLFGVKMTRLLIRAFQRDESVRGLRSHALGRSPFGRHRRCSFLWRTLSGNIESKARLTGVMEVFSRTGVGRRVGVEGMEWLASRDSEVSYRLGPLNQKGVCSWARPYCSAFALGWQPKIDRNSPEVKTKYAQKFARKLSHLAGRGNFVP